MSQEDNGDDKLRPRLVVLEGGVPSRKGSNRGNDGQPRQGTDREGGGPFLQGPGLEDDDQPRQGPNRENDGHPLQGTDRERDVPTRQGPDRESDRNSRPWPVDREDDGEAFDAEAYFANGIPFEEGEEEDEPAAPRRRGVRNLVMALIVAALVGNLFAFWPQIYNRETLPFLFKSRELSAREEIQSYKEAVVLVSTDKGKGTGFHISRGYIVTNYHVIEDAGFSLVKFPGDDREYRAEPAGVDPAIDIAILRIEADGGSHPSIALEREQPWAAGDPIYVIGNPLYFTQIAGEGRVQGLVPIRGRERPVLSVDAPVFKGNSGSPVVNERGRAIAVIYATGEIQQEGGDAVQVGLAVPLSDMDRLLDGLGF